MLTTILLDVDNTLLDFNACALASMKDAFAYFHLPFSKETVFPVFLEINSKLWTQIEDGVLTKEQHYQIRWKTILQALGIPFDGVTLEKKFVEGLHEYAIPVEGARELLEYLKSKYVICAASNAPYEQQIHRLQLSGFYQYMDAFYISEKIGHQKPSKHFFMHCLHEQGISNEQAIVIGDSLQADIQGGINANIQTIWFNPSHKIATNTCKPTYEVDQLKKIKKIL